MSAWERDLALAHTKEHRMRVHVRKLESASKRVEGVPKSHILRLVREALSAARRGDWVHLAKVGRRIAYLADGHKARKALPTAKQELAAARVELNNARALAGGKIRRSR